MMERDVDNIVTLLRSHKWETEFSHQGEFLIITASRSGKTHRIAYVRSTAIDNRFYKSIEPLVEAIYTKEFYNVESFAYGIKTPVLLISDFFIRLLEWNEGFSDGRLVSDGKTKPAIMPNSDEQVLESDIPIDKIWSKIRSLGSHSLARKQILERYKKLNLPIPSEEVLDAKAHGLAFSLRNATEYYIHRDNQSLSQKLLNLYYGTMAFVFSEMSASPQGPSALSEIEEMTKKGHGLHTVDGEDSSNIETLINVVALDRGLFCHWMSFLGHDTSTFVKSSKRPETFKDLQAMSRSSYFSIGELFARIPEILDTFMQVSNLPPYCVSVFYEQDANSRPSLMSPKGVNPKRSYIRLHDPSGRMDISQIEQFPGALSQIQYIDQENRTSEKSDRPLPGTVFRALVNHPKHKYWFEPLGLHYSPYCYSSFILPIFGNVVEHRAIVVVLLYALSILVRYRPSIWRQISEGQWDHYRFLIEEFVRVVERLIPQEFLEVVSDRKIRARQPSSLW